MSKQKETEQVTQYTKITEKQGSSLLGKVVKGVVVATAFAAGAATGIS